MNCKKCQAELAEDAKFCPQCGTEVDGQETKPGLSAGKIALLVALAVVAVALIVALIAGGMGGENPSETTEPQASAPAESTPATIPPDGNPDDATCKGSYTVTDDVMLAEASTVVATMGDAELTNGQLQIYYWMQVYDFLNQYGSYAAMFGLDYTQPLEMQTSIEGKLTWQQYFLDSAVDTWRNYQAMCFEAEATGYELDKEYADYLAGLPTDLEENAKASGYESAVAMVQADMGPGTTVADYLAYLEHYYLGYMYYGDTLETFELTDEIIEAYFDEHAAEYEENDLTKGDAKYVDVRHILLQPTGGTKAEDGTTTYSDAEWAACEKAANDVLNTWLSGEKTEDAFAELAKTHSTDTGSNTSGGLYTNVQKGDMVEPFENWCFDEARKNGDYGIVKTTYGYHVMYFVKSELVWKVTAREDLLMEKGNEFLQGALQKHPADVDYSAMVIGNVKLADEA